MSGAVRPLGLGLWRRAEGEPRQAEAGLMDTPWCRRQGLASLGPCSARLLLSLSSVIKLPYLSCLHHPHLHPMAHMPTPTSTRGPAYSGPVPHPQLLKESLVSKAAGSSC